MRTEDGYIIYRCLNGDSAAFGFLVDKYKAGVYAFAYERLHNFHDAEDVAQEAFFKAYRSLRTLRRWDSFASWLYRITLNLCRNWIRAQSSRPDDEFVEDQAPELLETHSRNLYRQELVCESVREALDSLPEMYRQVLTLHYFGGMTSTEIARFVGVSSSAIRMRLRKARLLLKEEILAMMNTTFEEQKLQVTFTFRIMEAVKRIRIHPTPRTAGLPWGLSLATGIVITILSLSPHLSIPRSMTNPTGSRLAGETKVLRIGEIPVDILKVSEVPVLANKQGDGDGGEPGSSDPRNATLAAAHDEENIRMQESKKVIIGPETGVKYTKTRTLTGKRDVIERVRALNLSPNGKFLLWNKTMIPLDDGEPFDLVDMPAACGSLSPDGKKVVFRSGGAIWVISVSPETGRSTGPAKKLLDGGYWTMPLARWSPDSERIVFERREKDGRGDIWDLSVKDGSLTQITGDPIGEGWPVWSPDGKTIAYKRGDDETWVIPAKGGTARKISSGKGRWFSWSPDSEWLVYGLRRLRFLRLADGREFHITTPSKEVGDLFSWSPDGKKMLFYKSSYDYKSSLKVVSVSGGPSFELGGQLKLWPYTQFWSPDGRMIVADGVAKDGDRILWIIPLAGGDPFLLELDVSVPGKPSPRSLSPDRRKLLFSVDRGDNTEDLWVVPVSLKDGRTTGPAVMVFAARDGESRGENAAWSPDGTKIAVSHEWNIWIASADGGEPVQITETPEAKLCPQWVHWVPGGEMIAYRVYHSQKEQPLMVISASGGEPRKVLDTPIGYAWSPDGKELAFISERFILAIPIAGGKARRIVDRKELGVDEVSYGFCWSPDGRHLAFASYNRVTGKPGPGPIFMVSAEGGEITKLATDDPGQKDYLYWSPDGKWISYNSDTVGKMIKTRPGGQIWEADFEEILGKLSD